MVLFLEFPILKAGARELCWQWRKGEREKQSDRVEVTSPRCKGVGMTFGACSHFLLSNLEWRWELGFSLETGAGRV